MDEKMEAEHQRTAAVEQQIVALIERARGLIIAQFAPLVAAIEQAEKLVNDAHTIARQYNLDEGVSLVFNEDFALSVDNKPARWWKENLTAAAVRVNGQTEPQPGVRLQLPQDVVMRDYPQQCAVAVPRPKAERLIAEHRGYRV